MRQNINMLSKKVIVELVKFTDTSVGAIYLVDDNDPENIKLINSGSYCYESDKIKKNKDFIPGEGLIGSCYKDKEIMQIDNLPEGYINLHSGIGSKSLKHCLLVPVIDENTCQGIIELASAYAIEAYKINFITKLTETLASVITINKATDSASKMLEINKIQAEELKTQEEELRQNLEEMQTTQEELKKQIETSEKTNEKLLFEQSFSNSLLENAPEGIYFKDIESRFLKVSRSMKSVFNVKKVEDIYGKSDFDFFTEEHARPAFEDEQMIIKTGKPIIDKIEKETHADGRITYVTTTKMPLRNHKGKIIGTFGISKNITELIELKQNLEKREKEMNIKEKMIANLQTEIKKKEAVIKKLEEKIRKKS